MCELAATLATEKSEVTNAYIKAAKATSSATNAPIAAPWPAPDITGERRQRAKPPASA